MGRSSLNQGLCAAVAAVLVAWGSAAAPAQVSPGSCDEAMLRSARSMRENLRADLRGAFREKTAVPDLGAIRQRRWQRKSTDTRGRRPGETRAQERKRWKVRRDRENAKKGIGEARRLFPREAMLSLRS